MLVDPYLQKLKGLEMRGSVWWERVTDVNLPGW